MHLYSKLYKAVLICDRCGREETVSEENSEAKYLNALQAVKEHWGTLSVKVTSTPVRSVCVAAGAAANSYADLCPSCLDRIQMWWLNPAAKVVVDLGVTT